LDGSLRDPDEVSAMVEMSGLGAWQCAVVGRSIPGRRCATSRGTRAS